MERLHIVTPWVAGPMGNAPHLPDGFIGGWQDITGQDAADLYKSPPTVVLNVACQPQEADKLESDSSILVLLRETLPEAPV